MAISNSGSLFGSFTSPLMKMDEVKSPFVREMLGKIPTLQLAKEADDLSEQETTKKNYGIRVYKIRKDILRIAGGGIPDIRHEIGHMLELNNFSRLLQDDFGMRNGFPESARGLFAALARETRVRAIQLRLTKENATEFIFINSFWLEETHKHLHFGKFKCPEDIKNWVHDLGNKTLRAWNKDRIMTEWNKRVEYIRNWQETK